MGYRSDVAMAIYGDDINHVINYFNEEFDKLSNDTKDFIKDGIHITDNKIIISYDDIKWYDERDFVILFNNLWKYSKGYDADGINGEYLIIGEDLRDITEESFGNDLEWIITINRTILINNM